jgi:hypothetical protein
MGQEFSVVQNSDKDKLLTRYLLRDLSDEEQASLEEEYFGDEDFFEQMLIAEDELIDDYVRGELSSRERELFEKHFMLSEKVRQRLVFARMLTHSTRGAATAETTRTPEPEPVNWWQASLAFLRAQNPIMQFAQVALVLVLVALALFTVARWRGSERSQTLARQETNQPQDQPQRGTQPPTANVPSNQNSKGPLPATLLLVPGSVRSADEAHTLSIPTDAEQALVQIILEKDSYRLYRAEVRKIQGRDVTLWKDDALASHSTDSGESAIDLKIPAKLLTAGDYKVSLGGVTEDQKIEAVADYTFRVVRK